MEDEEKPEDIYIREARTSRNVTFLPNQLSR